MVGCVVGYSGLDLPCDGFGVWVSGGVCVAVAMGFGFVGMRLVSDWLWRVLSLWVFWLGVVDFSGLWLIGLPVACCFSFLWVWCNTGLLFIWLGSGWWFLAIWCLVGLWMFGGWFFCFRRVIILVAVLWFVVLVTCGVVGLWYFWFWFGCGFGLAGVRWFGYLLSGGFGMWFLVVGFSGWVLLV